MALPSRDQYLQELQPLSLESCDICHELMEDPTRTTCRHVYCFKCLHAWLETHSNCPTCRTKLFSGARARSAVSGRELERLLVLPVAGDQQVERAAVRAPNHDVSPFSDGRSYLTISRSDLLTVFNQAFESRLFRGEPPLWTQLAQEHDVNFTFGYSAGTRFYDFDHISYFSNGRGEPNTGAQGETQIDDRLMNFAREVRTYFDHAGPMFMANMVARLAVERGMGIRHGRDANIIRSNE